MIDFTKFSNIISLTSYFNTEARGIPTICPCCGKSVEGENYMVGAHVELFIELASIKHK